MFPSISVLIPDLVIGDEEAWTKLFAHFRQGLLSKARNLCRGASLRKNVSADDLVQETFLKAWNSHHSFRGRSTSQFSKWILTILRNTFRDSIDSHKQESDVPSWYDFHVDSETPSSRMMTDEREAELHACLAEIDSEKQMVLTMRHFEGLRFTEIATLCDANVNTIASHYRRGIHELARLLQARSDPSP